MEKIILKRVKLTTCKDCVFYADNDEGCQLRGSTSKGVFACIRGDKLGMWVIDKEEKDKP